MKKINYCRKCGATIVPEGKFCINCGEQTREYEIKECAESGAVLFEMEYWLFLAVLMFIVGIQMCGYVNCSLLDILNIFYRNNSSAIFALQLGCAGLAGASVCVMVYFFSKKFISMIVAYPLPLIIITTFAEDFRNSLISAYLAQTIVFALLLFLYKRRLSCSIEDGYQYSKRELFGEFEISGAESIREKIDLKSENAYAKNERDMSAVKSAIFNYRKSIERFKKCSAKILKENVQQLGYDGSDTILRILECFEENRVAELEKSPETIVTKYRSGSDFYEEVLLDLIKFILPVLQTGRLPESRRPSRSASDKIKQVEDVATSEILYGSQALALNVVDELKANDFITREKQLKYVEQITGASMAGLQKSIFGSMK